MKIQNQNSGKWFSILTALVVIISANSSNAAMAAWVDVSADGHTYYVQGGIVTHSSFTEDRAEAATCGDCFWRVVKRCTSWDDPAKGNCPDLLSMCSGTLQPVRIFRANAKTRPADTSSLWRFVVDTCQPDSGPASTRRITDALTGNWQADVPALVAKFAPPTSAVVNHPNQLHYISPSTISFQSEVVSGLSVQLRAFAGRYVTCETTNCNRPTSNLLTFDSAGTGSATVHATWRADFSALGLHNIPVPDDPIRQTMTVQFKVYAIHRKLQ